MTKTKHGRNTSSQQGGQYAGQNAAMPPADQQQQQPPAAKKKSGFSSVFSSGGSGGGSGGSGGSGAAINPALERARSANAERTATGGGASSEPSFQVTVGAPAASGAANGAPEAGRQSRASSKSPRTLEQGRARIGRECGCICYGPDHSGRLARRMHARW